MNKLEEYRDKSINDILPIDSNEFSYKEGFDAAIALDLPVKFLQWIAKEGYSISYTVMDKIEYAWASKVKKVDYKAGLGTMPIKETRIGFPDLYQYWIDNIYKIE